jgi:hypothetical protein
VQLIDDLLEIVAEQRLEDRQNAQILAEPVQHRIEVGGPLHVAEDAPQTLVIGDTEKHIAVPEAFRMNQSVPPYAIECRHELGKIRRPEHAPYDGVAVALEITHVRRRDPRRFHFRPLSHGNPPLPRIVGSYHLRKCT